MKAPKPAPRPAIADALRLLFIDGEVVFIGDRLGFSMTPTAAAETAQRLATLLQNAPRR